MTDFTVTIAKKDGATIKAGLDNLSRVSLTVEPRNNCPNIMQLYEGDTIKWERDDTLSDWEISTVVIGRTSCNVNTAMTQAVFCGTKDLGEDPPAGPADVDNLQKICTPTEETLIKSFSEIGSERVRFKYRINFTSEENGNWFIDPEIDVSPAGRPPGPETDGTAEPTTPLGLAKTTTLYATVNDRQRIIHGMSDAKVVPKGAGVCQVFFNADVSLGSYVVSTVSNGSDAQFATASPGPDPTLVTVRTFDKNFKPKSIHFSLIVATAYATKSMT